MKAKSTPAVEKAVTYLMNYLNTTCNSVLPGIRTLARDCGVSAGSMHKAVKRLVANKVINTIERGRTRRCFPSYAANSQQPVVHQTAWRRIAANIKKSIFDGLYLPDDSLTSLQQLRHIYGCSYRTLKIALESLVQEGYLQRYKRGYSICSKQTPIAHATIVFLIPDDTAKLYKSIPRFCSFLVSLQQHCIALKINLEIVCYGCNYRLYPDYLYRLDSVEKNRSVLGYLLWIGEWYLNPAGKVDFNYLLSAVHIKGKPIGIFDEMGLFEPPPPLRNSYRLKVITLASRKAGQEVARILIQNGHQRIAYISFQHIHRWSQLRLQGIRDVVEPWATVIPMVTESIGNSYELALALLNFDEKTYRKILLYISHDDDSIEEKISHYKKLHKAGIITDSIREAARPTLKVFNKINELCDSGANPILLGRLLNETLEYTKNFIVYIYLEPIFRTICSQYDSTAWVCANDITAINALNFLKSEKIPVPQSISIVGFDDITDAFLKKLSSYNFNLDGIVRGLLSFILNKPTKHQEGPIIEFEGYFVGRCSTAAAPKSHSSGRF